MAEEGVTDAETAVFDYAVVRAFKITPRTDPERAGFVDLSVRVPLGQAFEKAIAMLTVMAETGSPCGIIITEVRPTFGVGGMPGGDGND